MRRAETVITSCLIDEFECIGKSADYRKVSEADLIRIIIILNSYSIANFEDRVKEKLLKL